MSDTEKKDLTYLNEAKTDYDRRVRFGETAEYMYGVMKQTYTSDVLTSLFPYPFIFDNVELGWDMAILLDSYDFVELYRMETGSRKTYELYNIIISRLEGSEYKQHWFSNKNIKFNDNILDIRYVPLDYISQNITEYGKNTLRIKNWPLGISNNVLLNENFIKRHLDTRYLVKNSHRDEFISRSIWDFKILLNRGICDTDIKLNLCMVTETIEVNVPSYFPIRSLEYFVKKPRMSCFVNGNEEQLDENMKFSELDTTDIFVLFS